jgi:hypothetical protein
VTFKATEVAVPVGHCVFFCVSRGSGSLGLPRSLLGLDRYRPDPRGLPELSPSPGLAWCTSASRPSGRCRPSWPSPLLQSALNLCWNSSQLPKKSRVPPLVGFARFPPLCRSTFCVSTPGSRGFLRADGANRRLTFRPRGFSPPRRLPPHRGCGFVAPRCRLWSSTRFPSRIPGHPRVSCKSFAFPAPRVIPFEEFPSSAAVPHHCGRCPLAFAARFPCLNLLDRSRAWHRPCSRSCRVGVLALSRAEAVVSTMQPFESKLSRLRATLSAETVQAAMHPVGPKPSRLRAPPLAEAGVGACPQAGRGQLGCGASVGAEASVDAIRLSSEKVRRIGPDCPATEAAVQPPKGPIHLTDRGRCGVHRPPRWVAEAKSRCAALVMLRSAEADPHVTNRALRAGRRTDLPRPRRASFRGPKALVRRVSRTTLQSVRGLMSRADRSRATRPCNRTRVCGAFDDARCRTPPSTPLRWSS